MRDTQGLFAAELLVKALSSQQTGKLILKNGPPGYDAETRTLSMPAWPTQEFPPEDLRRLRAFLSHESARHGQQQWTPQRGPWAGWQGYTHMVQELTAPVYDAALAETFPGAGMNIRETLREQAELIEQIQAKTPFEVTLPMVATLTRLAHAGTRSFAELRTAFPQFAQALQTVERFLPQRAASEAEITKVLPDLIRALNLPDQELPPQASDGSGQGQGNDQQESGQQQQGQSQGAAAPGNWNLDQQILQQAMKSLWNRTKGPGRYTFTRAYDTIKDMRVKHAPAPDPMPASLKRQAQVLATTLRRALETESMLVDRYQRRGSLDLSQLTPFVLGKTDRVFKRQRMQPGIDVAVSLSVDASGSMSSEWDLVKNTMQVLDHALALLRVPMEIITWTTRSMPSGAPPDAMAAYYRQDALRYHILRSFDVSGVDKGVEVALQQRQSMGGTPTAEGLLLPAERLGARHEQRKVLFFVTDGDPGFNHSGSWQVHDEFLQDILQRCEAANIEVVLLGIGMSERALSESLKRFPRRIILEKPDQLGKHLQAELYRILRSMRRAHFSRVAV